MTTPLPSKTAAQRATHQAAEALRESGAQLRGLVENLPDFVLLLDCSGTIQFINRVQPGRSLAEVTGRSAYDFVLPEDHQRMRTALAEAIQTRQVRAFEFRDLDGRWYESRAVPLIGDDGVRGLMSIATDITQRRQAAEAVEKEQRLLRHLIELHERERRLVAYEIHDGLAQQTTAALLHLQGFRERLSCDPQAAWATFDAGLRLLRQSIDETRRLISGLRPPILDEMGIVAAIEYLVAENSRNGGPEIEFVPDANFGRLAPPLESAVFRIIQESLANACRHSGSPMVRIVLRQKDDRLCIDVQDWGTGFDPANAQPGRFGLQGIRERVRLLGGSASIETGPHRGTRIVVELPLIAGVSRSDNATPLDEEAPWP